MNSTNPRNAADFLANYQAIAKKIARSFAEHESDFDDLFQEICIAMWSVSEQIPDDVQESTYVYRVALNRAISWHRRRHTYARHLKEYFLQRFPKPAVVRSNTDTATDRLYRAIRKLGDSERSVILLHLEELSSDEIAGILGIQSANVRKRISRAKAKLASHLKNEVDNHET